MSPIAYEYGLPDWRRASNIENSIRKWIREQFEEIYGYSVNYGDRFFEDSSLDQWVSMAFVSHGAGRMDSTMAQFDFFSRTRGKLSSGDRYGAKVEEMVDRFHVVMHAQTIQLYDFSDPSNPVVIAGKVVMVQNSNGTFREPESDQDHGFEDGVAWRSLTYRFRLPGDASAASQYYD